MPAHRIPAGRRLVATLLVGAAALGCAGFTACEQSSGAADGATPGTTRTSTSTPESVETSPAGQPATATATSPPADATAATGLGALLATSPRGYEILPGATGQLGVGSFDAQRFLTSLSSTPDEDARLFARGGFVAGHHAFTRMATNDHWLHIYLYRMATEAGARTLFDGFAAQIGNDGRFAAPGVPRAHTSSGLPGDGADSTYRSAQVLGRAGTVVFQVIAGTTAKRPDTTVAAAVAKRQYEKLRTA